MVCGRHAQITAANFENTEKLSADEITDIDAIETVEIHKYCAYFALGQVYRIKPFLNLLLFIRVSIVSRAIPNNRLWVP